MCSHVSLPFPARKKESCVAVLTEVNVQKRDPHELGLDGFLSSHQKGSEPAGIVWVCGLNVALFGDDVGEPEDERSHVVCGAIEHVVRIGGLRRDRGGLHGEHEER
jgi:hypothetical protein